MIVCIFLLRIIQQLVNMNSVYLSIVYILCPQKAKFNHSKCINIEDRNIDVNTDRICQIEKLNDPQEALHHFDPFILSYFSVIFELAIRIRNNSITSAVFSDVNTPKYIKEHRLCLFWHSLDKHIQCQKEYISIRFVSIL